MAKDPKPEIEAEDIVDTPAAPKSYRLHILLGLVLLVLLQTTAMVFLLPKPGDVRRDVDASMGGSVAALDYQPDVLPTEERNTVEMVEKSLGDKFMIQETNRGTPGQTDIFTVTIYVMVKKSDESAFDKEFTTKQMRIRDAVTIVLRASSMEDRLSETLGNIRARIKRRVNEEMSSPFVRGVICTDPKVETM